jgi:uncharacterized membrane protein
MILTFAISVAILSGFPDLRWMNDKVQTVLGFVLFFPLAFVVAIFVRKLDWIPSWLYVNINLRTKFGIADSKKITQFITPCELRPNWITFKEVKKYPRILRREILLNLIEKAPEHLYNDLFDRAAKRL